MKKLSMLLGSAFIMALSFSSCSDDDKGSSVTEEKLTGKWGYSTTKFSGAGQSTDEEPYFGNADGCPVDYLQLNDDGTLIDGDFSTGDPECVISMSGGSWTLDGKTLTLTRNGGADVTVYKVSSVSGSKLKVVETMAEGGGVSIKETTTFNKAD